MKRLTLAVFIFVGLLSTGAFANDQLAFNDALEAFNNAKAPTLSDFSGKLAPLAFAIEGDQVDKKASKKIVKSKLQLKIETDALGKMHIYDPNLTYSYNGEDNKNIELTLSEKGLAGRVDRGDDFFRLQMSQECRKLETSSIICKVEMYITNTIDLTLITIYKPL